MQGPRQGGRKGRQRPRGQGGGPGERHREREEQGAVLQDRLQVQKKTDSEATGAAHASSTGSAAARLSTTPFPGRSKQGMAKINHSWMREGGSVGWLTTFSFHDKCCTRHRRLMGARIRFLAPSGDHLGEKWSPDGARIMSSRAGKLNYAV